MVMANFLLNTGLSGQRQHRKEVWLYDLFQALLHLTCTIGKFHSKITAHCRFPILKDIIINMSTIYKVHEFTGDLAIVSGWYTSTEILGFLGNYVVSRHLLKQVSAGNLVAGAASLSWSRSSTVSGKCSWSSLLASSGNIIACPAWSHPGWRLTRLTT